MHAAPRPRVNQRRRQLGPAAGGRAQGRTGSGGANGVWAHCWGTLGASTASVRLRKSRTQQQFQAQSEAPATAPPDTRTAHAGASSRFRGHAAVALVLGIWPQPKQHPVVVVAPGGRPCAARKHRRAGGAAAGGGAHCAHSKTSFQVQHSSQQAVPLTWHLVYAFPHGVRRGEVEGRALHRRNVPHRDRHVIHLRQEGSSSISRGGTSGQSCSSQNQPAAPPRHGVCPHPPTHPPARPPTRPPTGV